MVQRRRAWLRRFGKAAHSPPAAPPNRLSVRKWYGDHEDTSIKALIIADRLSPRKTLHFTLLFAGKRTQLCRVENRKAYVSFHLVGPGSGVSAGRGLRARPSTAEENPGRRWDRVVCNGSLRRSRPGRELCRYFFARGRSGVRLERNSGCRRSGACRNSQADRSAGALSGQLALALGSLVRVRGLS